MFNKLYLEKSLDKYKENFLTNWWNDEKYKWEAVKYFQENWNVSSDNFAEMLEKSLSKTKNLLASVNNFPAGMIIKFAEIACEEVRAMFIELYDENKDVYERISRFKQKSDILLEKYGNGAAKHYQNENAISTYLWLRYPDKYYIYKPGEVKIVSDRLESSYTFKKGSAGSFVPSYNIHNFFQFYDEICAELNQDMELKNLLASQLTENCYPDTALKTLTVDVGTFISKYTDEPVVSRYEWWPIKYNPGFTVDDWKKLLNDKEIFNKNSLEIMKRILDYGGEATCKQLSTKYGESWNFYNAGSSSLARRIVQKTGCPVMVIDNKNSKWWPVLYVGKYAKKDCEGLYIWKLRDELFEALKRTDLSKINLYANSTEHLLQTEKQDNEYKKEDFLKEVYMTEAEYNRLAAVLMKKKNIILQGAPGVGKTFAAKRLAYSVMGEKDDKRIEFIQFHQNYSYEDFMMGYKPSGDGFELKYGIFYRFCQKAAENPEENYFFIIDEINRGNMSKIFGELLMLIEADYRGRKAVLAYNGEEFSVPENLHIIGMMNTADRSLAMIDYALRRRFSFFDIEPGFDSDGFIRYQNRLADNTFNTLIERIKELNNEIMQDKSLGKGFCIGHSYFCNADNCTEEWLRDVVDFDILPMLSEYWFDDYAKLQRWENILHGVFQ